MKKIKQEDKKLSDRLKEARSRFDGVEGPSHTLLSLDMDISVSRLRMYIKHGVAPTKSLPKILKYLRKKGL